MNTSAAFFFSMLAVALCIGFFIAISTVSGEVFWFNTAQPTSAEQRQLFEDYATLKHFPNVEAFCLYAMGSTIKKVPLTEDEKTEYVQLQASRAATQKR